jgi:dienelactone hydrolase
MYLDFTDKERPEILTEDTTDNRDITMKIWYPAQNKPDKEYAPYIKNGNQSVEELNLPSFYQSLQSHAKLNLPLSNAEQKYPILIFNHGWGEHYSQNTVLMEELASHGYIVFSIAHHYEARFSFYPDGKTVIFDSNNQSEHFQQIMGEQQNPDAIQIFRSMYSAQSTEQRENVFKRTNELMPAFMLKGSKLWAKDITTTIDHLEVLESKKEFFKGRLNLDKIGVFGMSLGGTATGQACLMDDRIKAGINMDGGIFGDILDTRIAQPFMFINSVRYRGYQNLFLKRIKNQGIVINIENDEHYNFHDISVLNPDQQMLGTIDGQKMLNILNDYTLAFFDKFLKGSETKVFKPGYEKYTNVKIFTKDL